MQSNQRMVYEKTRITMWMTALHSEQLAPMSATRLAQFSQNVWPHGTKGKPSIGANKQTSQHRGYGTATAGAAGTSLSISSPSLSSPARSSLANSAIPLVCLSYDNVRNSAVWYVFP